MPLKLVIGNKNYSSWSLRPWLLMKELGIPFEEVLINLGAPDSKKEILRYSTAGKVPTLLDGNRTIWDSLAIAEYLAEQFPEKKAWPENPDARAVARSICAEMHSSFQNLRSNMPMNVRSDKTGKGLAPGVQEDVGRIQAIWRECREKFGKGGDFLFGRFSAADAFYAPIVTRFKTYGVPLDGTTAAYSKAIFSLPAMMEWVEAAKKEPWVMEQNEK